MTNTITEETRAELRAALLDETIHLGMGVGSMHGARCTIAEINLILTGRLTDRPHPCISELVRQWVVRIQDAIPDKIRNGTAWRTAAVGIAGSTASPEVEQRRADMLLAWMWDRLADPDVIKSVPAAVLPAWRAMLAERTVAAAYAVARVADSADADTAYAAADSAVDAVRGVTYSTADAVDIAYSLADGVAYWQRADVPGMLARLVSQEEESCACGS